jgi:hypothetical protein
MSSITTSRPKSNGELLDILHNIRQRHQERHQNQPLPSVFNSLNFAQYCNSAFAPQPKTAVMTNRTNGELEYQQGFISLSDLNHRFPKELNEREQEQQAVWEQWNDDVPLYDAVHVYRLIGYKETFTSWRSRYDLPHLLSARQAGYLIERAVAANEHADPGLLKVAPETSRQGRPRKPRKLPTTAASLFNWRDPKHPWPTGLINHFVKTKVGRTYGTWQFLSCLSEDENTSGNKPVYYQAACIACGHKQTLNYRRMSAPCPACMTQFKGKLTQTPEQLRHMVTIYYMGEGQFRMGSTVPKDAKGRIVFLSRNQSYGIEFFSEEDKAADALSTDLDIEVPPPEEIKVDTFLPTSDMPF